MKKFYLVCLTLLSFGLSADVTIEKMTEIESRVDSMSLAELQDRRSFLRAEERQLMATQSSTQNPTTVKTTSGRLAEIRAELSAIQKALLAVAGLAAINSLTDDGFDDNVPPVITINGSNPDSVELGSTYSDPGATAFDEYHGSTPVTSSGTVDTSAVGSYTITYTATDKDGNTATATRTVNVVDTTAPEVTVTGDNPATTELGADYEDAGATATDASGTVEVVTTGTVDKDTVGEYTLTYTATDASGNAGTATRTVNVTDTTSPVFTSSSTFVVDENVTEIGTVTVTELDTVTFTIGVTTSPALVNDQYPTSNLVITSDGVLSFDIAPDYDLQVPDVVLGSEPDAFGSSENWRINSLSGYETGATMDFTATVTATDASGNTETQDITVQVRDVGGVDDDTGTGTGTGTGTSTGTATSGTGSTVNTRPQFTSSDTFVVDEGVVTIGTVTSEVTDGPTDIEITYTIGATTSNVTYVNDSIVPSNLVISSDGVLSFDSAPDYESQLPDWDSALDQELFDDRDAYLDCTNTGLGAAECVQTLRTQSLDGYKSGATMDFTAIVTATVTGGSGFDGDGNVTTISTGMTNNQTVTVQVRDKGGYDDDTGTGTGTDTISGGR
jgi:hypothetical protein